MTFRLDGPVFDGRLVCLEPLDHRHASDLARAADEDLGTYGSTWVPTGAQIDGYINEQLGCSATGNLLPYA